MKVRIAVAVGPDGNWAACGFRSDDDGLLVEGASGREGRMTEIREVPKAAHERDGVRDYRVCWVVADVPELEPEVEVEGEVEDE